jgi:hypothetical protein
VKAIICAPLEFNIVVAQLPSTLEVFTLAFDMPPYPPPHATSDKTNISRSITTKPFITCPIPANDVKR